MNKLNKKNISDDFKGVEYKIDWTGEIFNGSNNNKYILIKRIGYGSYSSVWLTYKLNNNNKSNNIYAIKIHNTGDIKEGLKEIKIYKKFKELKIPNAINCVDEFVINKTTNKNTSKHVCIVLDLYACSLYDLINSGKYKNGLDIDLVINITKQILESLQKMHENGIIHTDIKPENILLSGINNDNKKILDNIKNKIGLKSIKKYIEKNIELFSDSSDDYTSSSYDSDESSSICSQKQDEDEISLLSIDEDDYDFSSSDINNLSESNEEPDEEPDEELINDDYLKNPKIVITDLGTCEQKNEKQKKSIQTKYYKSPEVLLRLGYDSKSDIWALGCTIYELITGKILFDTDDERDEQIRTHLKKIIEISGPIPDEMINKSYMKEAYFTKDNRLKKTQKFTNSINKLSSLGKTDYHKKFIQIVCNMLQTSSEKRPSSKSCLEFIKSN